MQTSGTVTSSKGTRKVDVISQLYSAVGGMYVAVYYEGSPIPDQLGLGIDTKAGEEQFHKEVRNGLFFVDAKFELDAIHSSVLPESKSVIVRILKTYLPLKYKWTCGDGCCTETETKLVGFNVGELRMVEHGQMTDELYEYENDMVPYMLSLPFEEYIKEGYFEVVPEGVT